MNIHLHIDELVLDGLPVEAGGAVEVKAAVEAELTRLLTSGALAPGLHKGGALASVPSEDINLAGGDTPADLGRQIGRAVYGGMNR